MTARETIFQKWMIGSDSVKVYISLKRTFIAIHYAYQKLCEYNNQSLLYLSVGLLMIVTNRMEFNVMLYGRILWTAGLRLENGLHEIRS